MTAMKTGCRMITIVSNTATGCDFGQLSLSASNQGTEHVHMTGCTKHRTLHTYNSDCSFYTSMY